MNTHSVGGIMRKSMSLGLVAICASWVGHARADTGEIRNSVAFDRCLEVASGGTAGGTPVRISTCDQSEAERWARTTSGQIQSSVAPNMCLDVMGGNPAPGT